MKYKLIPILVTISLILNIYLLFSNVQFQENVTELETNVTELETNVTELETNVTELENEIIRQDDLLMFIIQNAEYCGNKLAYIFDFFGRSSQTYPLIDEYKDSNYYCSGS